MGWLYALPSAVLLVVVVAMMVVAAVGVHLFVYQTFASSDFSKNNTVVGTVMNVVGIVYAVCWASSSSSPGRVT